MTAEPIPAAKVGELFQLIDRLLSDDHAAPRVAYYQDAGMNPHEARAFALADRATQLRSLLAGLLSNRAGGVTPNAIEWATAWLRTELDRARERP